ncbi:putative invertase inhibitor [Beta vulgaris subsp. vulgaris]|uniref:putative invertase inhibitor n=1 Tax=Beta vulgaris subsp. vulgaris TaxID=3555 RepID=UPI0009010A64|nr:putative invertase inhibitor [Beta vulgaris subsp. vulgaris]
MEYYSMFLILFIISLSYCLANATNIVTDTCMNISKSDPDYIKYDFCVKTFESDPRSSNTSIDGLVEISFNLSSSKAISISTTIAQLLKDPKFDPFGKSALQACYEIYSDAPDDLQAGLEALKRGDFSTANVRVSGALDIAPDCEDSFQDKQGEVSPLTKDNSEFFQLVDISLAFTVLLKK